MNDVLFLKQSNLLKNFMVYYTIFIFRSLMGPLPVLLEEKCECPPNGPKVTSTKNFELVPKESSRCIPKFCEIACKKKGWKKFGIPDTRKI